MLALRRQQGELRAKEGKVLRCTVSGSLRDLQMLETMSIG